MKIKYMTMSEIDKLRFQANIAQFNKQYDEEAKLRLQIKKQMSLFYAADTNRKKRLNRLINKLEQIELTWPEPLAPELMDEYPIEL